MVPNLVPGSVASAALESLNVPDGAGGISVRRGPSSRASGPTRRPGATKVEVRETIVETMAGPTAAAREARAVRRANAFAEGTKGGMRENERLKSVVNAQVTMVGGITSE